METTLTVTNLCSNLYTVDISENEVITSIEINDKDSVDLLNKSIDNINKLSTRECIFESEESELRTIVLNAIEDKTDIENIKAHSSKISTKYARVVKDLIDRKGQLNVKNLNKTQLLVSIYHNEESTFLIICQLKDGVFFDLKALKESEGIYFDDNVLKSCKIEIDEENDDIRSIYINEKSADSVYWSKGFLDLREFHTSEKNTKDSFYHYDKYIEKHINKISPADGVQLRNILVGYYKTQPDFDSRELSENYLAFYTPENPEINMEKIKNDFIQLPIKKGFDSRFSIKTDVIRRNIKKSYPIHKNIELNIKGNVENLKEIIVAKKDPLENKKGIWIYSEDAYKQFFNGKTNNES